MKSKLWLMSNYPRKQREVTEAEKKKMTKKKLIWEEKAEIQWSLSYSEMKHLKKAMWYAMLTHLLTCPGSLIWWRSDACLLMLSTAAFPVMKSLIFLWCSMYSLTMLLFHFSDHYGLSVCQCGGVVKVSWNDEGVLWYLNAMTLFSISASMKAASEANAIISWNTIQIIKLAWQWLANVTSGNVIQCQNKCDLLDYREHCLWNMQESLWL